MNRAENVVKRIFDFSAALVLIILLSPLIVLISLVISWDSPGGPIFKQERVGKNEVPFTLYKFRSMVNNAEKIGAGLYFTGPDDPRLTRVGRILRRTSMDELPQLFNVLKGDMSIIGPRPTLLYQVQKYTGHQKKRLAVKPGITGWAQVNGRTKLSWSKRIEYDIWYIENYSLWLDLRILIMTVKVVITGAGIRYCVKPSETEDFSKKRERRNG